MPAKPIIKVYVNNNEAAIVWKYPAEIKDCWGFAIYRKRKGETDIDAEPLQSSVGFQDDPHTPFEMRPTTEWPIQKYIWIDYFVKPGDEVCYNVVPMLHQNGQLTKAGDQATGWTKMITIGDTGGVEAYFNRGLVSSQFLARRLDNIPVKERQKTLKANLANPKSAIRTFMGGNLFQALSNLLEDVADDKSLKLYAALYELNEFSLIDGLNKIGKRANVILANGAFGKGKPDPQAVNAKKLTKVNLTRRIVKTPHFAHNKFVVITQTNGGKEKPIKVLMGSTNWTTNGVFTQVNNAAILEDTVVCEYYKSEWDAIKADCVKGKGQYGKPYLAHNSTAKGDKAENITTYFTPVPKFIDMTTAKKYIDAAKHGILFLMFKPGVEGKSLMLYDDIIALKKKKDLLINGVLNSDPGGKANPTITFLSGSKKTPEPGNLDAVLPSSISERFQFWEQEVGKENVTIHSKAIVIDPFSDNPVLMTGSHNMGGKASKSNDDNLNIIVGNKPLAQAYAINMMAVYHHYRWRFYRQKKTSAPKWDGNIKSDKWQEWYLSGEKANEIKFWLGEG